MRMCDSITSGIRRARLRRWCHKNGAWLLMAVPGLALIFVFSYIPMFGIIIAFKKYQPASGILGSPWIGLRNFEFLFGSDTAWRITINTLYLNTIFIITSTIAALFLALLINEIRKHSPRLTAFYQSTFLLPHLVSYVVVGLLAFTFLSADSGFINQGLERIGAHQIGWYQSPKYWPAILTSINLWKHAGFSSLIYLAGLLAINPEYYEAAALDGATRWQLIRKISLPLLLPLVIITTLLAIGRIFYADFGLFYQVTRDNSLLYSTTDVIDTYVFRALRVTGDVGQAAAAGFFQSIVGFFLVVLANWAVRRIEPDRALF
jgi:putative aldouronate transport system permease protein